MAMANPVGVLLSNLGSPASPKTRDVRRFLKEFLSDPRVIDIPALPRWCLVHGIIAPFRAPKSAASYRKIWTDQGSPLIGHTLALAEAVEKELGTDFCVAVGMRYGEPSLREALVQLKRRDVSEIRILPLYPQYASSSTGSTEEAVLRMEKNLKPMPEIRFLPPFFDHPGFLGSFAEIGAPRLAEFHPDHILFSFHGLPERQILKGDPSGSHCLKSADCCEKLVPANGLCYRAHCFQTAYGMARLLNLSEENYSITFQSRLGRTPWIKPYTDLFLNQLARQGKKRVAVFCPSFVADCLETLEEIGIRAREQFKQEGGEELMLIPSLNSHPTWVKTVAQMLRGN